MNNQPESRKREYILIVDDHLDSIQPLSDLLKHQDYQVRHVTDGKMALLAVESEKPDLVLLGVELPILDGYDVCRELKSNATTRDIPIIFLSTSNTLLAKQTAFEAGGSDYITKPFQAAEVLLRINYHLGLYRQQQQLKLENTLLRTTAQQCEQVVAKYCSFFENSTQGIFQVAVDGHYISVNPALARIYGYASPEELISSVKNIGQQIYVQPKRREELLVYLRRFGYISEAESQVRCQDGSTIWISEDIWTVQDPQGQILYYEGTVHNITERRQMETELRLQRQRTEGLLGNVLPYQIAQRLSATRRPIADSFDEVTVMFADLVDFTAVSAQISPKDLVALLNQIFSAFDQLAEKYHLEKIKTIGDAYMVAAGLPGSKTNHAAAIAHMALDMQQVISQFSKPDGLPFQLRIGINTGAVVAGVIGTQKLTYDLWGDTVNIASRMESTGKPGEIQVTTATYESLKKQFVLEKRGSISIKGRGEVTTYWLRDRQCSDIYRD